MNYLTRRDDTPPANAADCQVYWRDVEALRAVQTLLARDLVQARRVAPVPSTSSDVTELNTVLTFISAKLLECNIAFYEAADSARHAPVSSLPPPHSHSHEPQY